MEKQRFFPIGVTSLIVAFLLLIIAIFFKSYIDNAQMGWMIICVGLGLILGAFGAVATIDIPTQGITVAGVAALALILFWFFNSRIEQKFLTVEISINQANKSIEDMHFYGNNEYPVSRERDGRLFKFLILEPNIDRPLLSLVVSNTDQEDPVALECIKSSFFKPLLSSGKSILLYYDEKEEKLIEQDTQTVLSGRGGCAVQNSVVENQFKYSDGISHNLEFSIFSQANAQAPTPENHNSTEDLINSLDSDNSYERRLARSKLAEQGGASAQILIDTFMSENKNSGRNRLKIGTLVALTEMSRDEETANKLSKIVSEEFIDTLINSVNDEDKTIRVYSTEFLSLIDSAKTTEKAIEKFDEASKDGKYNYALLIRNKAQTLSDAERKLLASKVDNLKSKSTPKTNEVINQISE